jgi:hypothetical protein
MADKTVLPKSHDVLEMVFDVLFTHPNHTATQIVELITQRMREMSQAPSTHSD